MKTVESVNKIRSHHGIALVWPIVLASAAVLGVVGGFVLAKVLKPDTTQYVVDEDAYAIDIKTTMKKYQAAKSKGDYSSLSAPEMINIGFELFGQEESNYSMGVGFTQAAMVKQVITARTAKEGNRYFEESNSSGLVNLYDRMFQEGDNTTLYWGDNPDYASHTPETITNEQYKEKMGRYVSVGLSYIVSEKTLLQGSSPSGDPPTGIYEENGGYRVEVELDPKTSTARYQKQMQSISSLKNRPTFDWVHLTVTLDKDLNLVRMKSHERYFATTSAGVGSSCTGELTNVYFHTPMPGGYPNPGSVLEAFPESL